jgi:threonine aldolase
MARNPSRRRFLHTSAAGGLLGLGVSPWPPAHADDNGHQDQAVQFLHDGLVLTPLEYSQLLEQLASQGQAEPDIYLAGGVVQQLEEAFAKDLGKEKALFMPTGTLSNHLAIRALAGDATRVLVPAESHIYNDSCDCVETLSHLNLVPLAPGKATFTAAAIEEAVRRAGGGPFPLRVGAIVIECPVRRLYGAVFDFEEMKRVSAYARKHGIGMHLDGARLYLASAYTGIRPAEYATLFDTIYVSLYKYFNAAGGAILAGPRATIDAVAHARKVFGSGVFQGWPQAAVALHYFTGFAERYRKAVATGRALFAQLKKDPRFRVEEIPGGTNIFRLHVAVVDPKKYQADLQGRGVRIRIDRRGPQEFLLQVNESLNHRSADELARAFLDALPMQ